MQAEQASMEHFQPIYIYKRIVQAKLFIDVHFAEEIDLDNISDEAYFSKFHFIRLFKSMYGKTPHHYLVKVRIEKARLLLEKEMTVTDVCHAVGFNSVTSFSTLFKKSTGMAPSVYQQQHWKRQQAISSKPLHFIPNCFAETHGWTKKEQF